MIGIIGAMSVEVEALKEKTENSQRRVISGIEFVSGRLCGKDVVIAQCGVGKVFASIAAQTMIVAYGVDAVINTGVAGTLTDKLSILDFAVSSGVVQHDMDTSPIGDPVGMISGINLVEIPASKRLFVGVKAAAKSLGYNCEAGIIASGDQFVASKERKSFIRDTFNAIACEMEGASIGHTCYVSGVEFVVIRCISDSASGEAELQYAEMVKRAAVRSQKLLMCVLNGSSAD